jgi:tetratricopeptide (TPR) repeat protein
MSARSSIVLLGIVPILLALSACTHTQKTAGARTVKPETADSVPVLSDKEVEERAETLAHFATGLSYEFNDDNKQAEQEYWKAATSDPSNEPLVLDLSRRLLRDKENERAIELLKKAAGQTNASGLLSAWLGIAYLQAGQTNSAIDADKTAIHKSPNNLLPYQNLSQIYFQKGETNEAIKIIDQAAGQPKTPPEFDLGLAEVYMRFARDQVLSDKAAREKIMGVLERAGKSKTDNPILLQRIADLYFLFGEPNKAEPFYSEILKEYPDAPGVRERLANIYFRSDQKAKAAEVLEGLRRSNPTDPSTYYLLGSLAYEGKDLQKATEYFDTAMKLNPDFEPIYYDLAGLKIAAHKPDEALAVLEKARAKFKLNFVLEFYSGIALSVLERYSEALSHLTSAELIAKTSEPERLNTIFYHQLGSTYERSGNIEDAEKAFKKCLELTPNDAESLNYLGYMWADKGVHLEEARTMIEKAVKLEPNNAAFLDSLAWVLFKLNKAAEGLEWIEKAVAHSEKVDPTLYEHWGDIEAELQHFEKAREAWNKSLEAEPNEKIKKKLESLNEKARSGQH